MENKIFITTAADKNRRLDNFLQTQIPDFTRSKIAGLIEKGLVKIGGKVASKNGEKLKENQTIEVEIPAPVSLDAKPENLPLEIVFEDDDLAVVNKPQGMVVHAGSGNLDKTLVNALLFHIKNLSGINGVLRPGIVHRLDKNTAGLLVVAKNDFAHTRLAAQLANKTCRREYVAIVEGVVKTDAGTIQTHIARSPKNRKIMAVCDESAGKVAITNFKVLQRFQGYTLMQFNLQTGRTHQIRV
ncbi:MAG: RluA family pseudouridine synthase, partial [Clostridia bacterium]|nr:RluA family pseudouridine synthase [Clostridia bacterium]